MIEDFESRPHKAVTFVVQRGRERQEWNEQKLPKEGKRKMRKSKKELEALRGWPSKEKTPYKDGIARRLRMKKKKEKVDKKANKWQDNEKRNNILVT